MSEQQPKVGHGATIYHFSDRSPATVSRVSPSGKTAWIRLDNYKADPGVDPYNSEFQSYTYTQNSSAPERRVTLHADGTWRIGGRRGELVRFGDRRKYHDPSF